MSDEWVDVPKVEPVATSGDGWENVPQAIEQHPAVAPLSMADPLMAGPRIKRAFDEGVGDEPFGMSQQTFEFFQKAGLFRTQNKIDSFKSVLQGNAESILYPAFAAADMLYRVPGGLYHAAQQAAIEWGAPKDVASIPDAFMGSPHPMGVPKVGEVAREMPREAATETAHGAEPASPSVAAPEAVPAPTTQPEDSPETPREAPPPGQSANRVGDTNIGFGSASMRAYRETLADPIQAARAADIIAPRPEATADMTPSEMAQQAYPRDLSSAAPSPEDVGPLPGHRPGEYDARGKEWVGKIDAPDDVREAIEKIAQDKDWFPEARGGVASPEARAAVAEAAGIAPGELDADHFATHFDNDGKVRGVIQALRQTASDVAEASDRMVKEPSVENAAALTEAQMRHGHVLEYVMGKRAESGRSLSAWKDLLRETERSKAKVQLRAKETTGEVPTGTTNLIDAAHDVVNNLRDGKPTGLQKLIDAAKELVGKEDEASVGRASPLDPDIAGLVGEARKVLNEWGKSEPTALDKLVKAAERQAENMVKQKAVKEPAEALPPELQALVDKAKRVTNRFGGIDRGEKAAMLLARTGKTAAEQEQLARSVAGLTPNQVAKVLEKLRTSAEADKPGWFFWLWQQGLISGLVTHTGYAAVNTATVFLERSVSPFVAAVTDRARGGDASMAGPIYANVAMVQAVPDAMRAAGEAFRTGNRVPLASEMRLFERGEESPQIKGSSSAYVQGPSPNWGIWKRVFNEDQLDSAARVLGIPGRSANLMHTFYKVLSERGAASNIAFEKAHAEGLKGDKFWDRYRYHLTNPSDEALVQAVNDAYSGAFMSKLDGFPEKAAKFFQNTPFRWLLPFQHIPYNIVHMGAEYSPLAILGPEMRGALLGKKGVPAQNLAIAKMTIGSTLMGYVMHKTFAGDVTGDYPTDPGERKDWVAQGIQPNSMKMGGQWVSLERLGAVSIPMLLGANLAQIIKHWDGKGDVSEEVGKAAWGTAHAMANVLGSEVGFQTLRNVMEAAEDEKKAQKFVALQASSFVPFSSFIGQNASIIDPYTREVKGIVDGLKYRIPGARETLLPKRDPVYGEPVPNPGYHTLRRMSPVNTDPVKFEMQRLQYHPTHPEDRINGVKLTPDVYDRYEAAAGAQAKQNLHALMDEGTYQQAPDALKREMIQHAIKVARGMAGTAIIVANPKILNQGLQQSLDWINGVSPTKRPKKAPEIAPTP